MGKRILVVESGVPVVPFDQSLLLRKEHDLHRASSGLEAVQKVELVEPSLIILDDEVPDMSLEELARRIRQIPAGKRAGVILLGGTPDGRAPEGINCVLPKPVVSHDLNEACRRLLSIAARKEARLLVYVQVQGFLQANMFLCNSLNLSASGILILTARKLKLGDVMQLQITLPREKEKVRVNGLVVREAVEVDTRLNAYGVSFNDVAEEDRARIRKFVEEEALRKRTSG